MITPDAALQGQTLVLEFEGVYHNAEVWLNGEKLAFNPYGYTDFKAILAPTEGDNVDDRQEESAE